MTTQHNNEAASAPATCKSCDGEGVIHTGIDEAPTTECMKCEGSGLAASASQSSTAVPRVGGPDEANTIDTPEFRERLRGLGAAVAQHGSYYRSLVGYVNSHFLAHVARQRQESAALPFRSGGRKINDNEHAARLVEYEIKELRGGALIDNGVSDTLQLVADYLRELATPSAAVAEGVDTKFGNLNHYWLTADGVADVFVKLSEVRSLSAAPPAKAEGMSEG